MKRWSWNRSRVLLLALLLGLGMSVSIVQSSVMSATMTISADIAEPESAGCLGCGGTGDSGAELGSCLSVCGSVAQGLLSGNLVEEPAASHADRQIVDLLIGGLTHRPDHGPPKILTLR